MTTAPVIIVGAGTAGSVVAKVLASATDMPVTVIEPGPRTDDDAPRFLDGLTAGVLWPGLPMDQARALGGGSAVNGMILSGEEPEWLRGLTRVAAAGEIGAVGRALIGAGGRPSRLWWNNGRWNPARAMLHAEEEGRITVLRDEVQHIEFDRGAAVAVVTTGGRHACSHVVLCAGALLTPALLQRSGMHSPVGDGLQNHPTVDFVFERPSGPEGFFDAAAVMDIVDGDATGLAIAYERLSRDDAGTAFVSVALMNPESRGSVRGGSVDFALLRTPRDIDAMDRLVRLVRDVVRSMGMATWKESPVHPVSHATSSCAAAVDMRGRLHGTSNVTVADASVLPSVPTETPAASVTISALRIARLLGEELT